jgi:hypothetical protein
MVGSSILPVSIHKGKLYFLFGKENELENSAKGFSDFGGGIESGESALDTACREGAEELTGFLGEKGGIKKWLNGGYLRFGEPDKYRIHVIRMDYDANLPIYYNNNHAFLWKKMDKHLLSKTKLFEKIEIQWFSVEDMKKRINEFRSFYQDILKQHIISSQSLAEIRKFIQRRNRHTRRRRAAGAKSRRRRR